MWPQYRAGSATAEEKVESSGASGANRGMGGADKAADALRAASTLRAVVVCTVNLVHVGRAFVVAAGSVLVILADRISSACTDTYVGGGGDGMHMCRLLTSVCTQSFGPRHSR